MFETNKLFNSFNKIFTALTFITLISFNFLAVPASSSPFNTYEENKQNIDKLLSQIDEEYENVNTNLESTEAQKDTLDEELKRLEREVRSIEIMLNTAKMTTEEVDKIILQNENKITDLNKELETLLRSIQQDNITTPFQVLLTSNNIGQAFGRMRNMSSIQNRVREVRDEIDFERGEIIKNRDLHKELNNSLPKKQLLLESKQEILTNLKAETNGDDQIYQEILAKLKKQEKELNSQLAAVNSELDTYRPNQSRTNCHFEDTSDLGIYKSDFVLPVQGYFTQRFHCRHDGIDIAAPSGTPIVSIADGEVTKKSFLGGSFGHYVIVKHDLKSGQTVYGVYAHMNAPASVNVGQVVGKGEQIGRVGSTGFSTGPHIHFMLMSDTYEKSNIEFCAFGTGVTKCFDPMRFFE